MQQPSHRDGFTVAQLVLSIVGILVYAVAAVLFFQAGITGEGVTPSLADSVPSLALGSIAVTCIGLLVPSLVLSIQRLRGSRGEQGIPSHRRMLLLASFGLVVWAGILLLGDTLVQVPSLRTILPIFTVLGAGLPIWWIYELGRLHLSPGSPQRGWGIFGFSITVTPLLILVVESILLVAALFVVIIAISANPQSEQWMRQLTNSLSGNAGDMPDYESLLTDIVQQPIVLAGLLLLTSVIVPVLEELLKPLALLVTAKRRPTPSQGFVGGMICGAAFAFLETSGTLVSSINNGWGILVLMRLGTGLLHITASGLVGWGMARALQQRTFRLFFPPYLLAVLMHGMWNAFGIMLGYLPFLGPSFEITSPLASWMARVAPYMLAVFTLLLFGVLVSFNRRVRKQANPPQLPQDN